MSAFGVQQYPSEPARVIGSYGTYRGAEHAVARLTARRFPVERVTIVAGDLRFVEQVTGRRGYVTAVLDGVTVGAVTGAVLGFVLGLFTLITPLTSGLALAVWGTVIGAFIGGVVGVIAHALSRAGRDFDSVQGLDAGRYDVLVPAGLADRARTLLDESSEAPAA